MAFVVVNPPLGGSSGGGGGGGGTPDPNSVGTTQLQNNAVTLAKIADGAVALAKLDAALTDPVAGTAGLRTLGTGAQQAAAGSTLAAHTGNTSNPHSTTAAQVGAIPTTALTATTPSAVGTAAAAGSSSNVARIDHVHQLDEATVRTVLAALSADPGFNARSLTNILGISGADSGTLAPATGLPADGTYATRFARRAGQGRLLVGGNNQWDDIARDLFAHEFEVQPYTNGAANPTAVQGPGITVLSSAYARGMEFATIGTVTAPESTAGIESDEPFFDITSPVGVSPFGVGGGSRGYATIYSGRAAGTGRGNLSRAAGFHVFWDFSYRTNLANKSIAIGLWARFDGGTADPLNRANGFGLIAQGAAGSNYQIVSRDGSTGITPIDTGLARNATDRLTFELFSLPGASWVGYRFCNRSTGVVVAEGRITSVLTAATTFLVIENTAETGTSDATAVTLRTYKIRGRFGRGKL